MIEYSTYGIIVVGIILLTICYLSVHIGNYIETLSTPKNGVPWFSKPLTVNKIASIIITILFIISGIIVITSTDIVIRIISIVSIISAYIFEVTVFSGAVMNAIKTDKQSSLSSPKTNNDWRVSNVR